VIFNTTLGGIKAVNLEDSSRFSIMIGSALVALDALLSHPGGWALNVEHLWPFHDPI